jgi:hypothetical protein
VFLGEEEHLLQPTLVDKKEQVLSVHTDYEPEVLKDQILNKRNLKQLETF